MREEQRHGLLLERVHEEERRRYQSDAPEEALEEALHDPVLGRQTSTRLHDPIVLLSTKIALHATLDRVQGMRRDAGQQRARQRPGSQRRVLLHSRAFYELLLDQGRDAQHAHGEHGLPPNGRSNPSTNRGRAVLLNNARGRS